MGNYSNGRRLEYMTKRWLQDSGYMVFRCAASRPADLVAIKDGKVLIIECKYGKKPRVDIKEVERWDSVSRRFGAGYVVCRREREGPMEFLSLQSGTLKEFLSL